MAKSQISDLLNLQGEDLGRLQDAQAAAVLRLANESRRELKEAYEALMASGGATKTPYTAQQMRVMLAQSERMVLVLRQRLDESLTTKAKLAGETALRDLLKVIRANEPDFKDAGNRVEMRALARISADQGLLLHRYSLDRYSSELMDAIQRELGVGLLRGLSIPQITERIAGTSKSVFAGKMHRAELIARIELNGAYNAMHQASLEEAAAELDDPDDPDPLLRRIDEYFDTRNNPFSRAAHGTVAGLKAPFRVSASAVSAAAAQLGKRVSGIVWPLEGATYVGMRLPAHYNERGRQVPHRASWGANERRDQTIAQAKAATPERRPASAPPATIDEIHRAAREFDGKVVGGLKMTVTARSDLMHVEFHTAGGARAGSASRIFKKIGTEELWVYHDFFFLGEEYQDHGAGKEFFRLSDAMYRRLGVRRLEVTAAGEVGRYVWAQYGFDFKPGSGRHAMRRHFVDSLLAMDPDLTEARALELVEPLKSAWDFANFEYVPGARTGKTLMLHGPAWSGELDMTPGSPSQRRWTAYLSKESKKTTR